MHVICRPELGTSQQHFHVRCSLSLSLSSPPLSVCVQQFLHSSTTKSITFYKASSSICCRLLGKKVCVQHRHGHDTTNHTVVHQQPSLRMSQKRHVIAIGNPISDQFIRPVVPPSNLLCKLGGHSLHSKDRPKCNSIMRDGLGRCKDWSRSE